MKTFQTAIVIRSSPEAIWAILTDGPRWPEWNTTVDKLEGTIAPGASIKVHAKLSPGRAFPVTVSGFEPGARMEWSGGMPLGLFKAVRTFTLAPTPDGAVEFRMHEVFSGPMAPLITRSIPDLQPSFEEFAAALKQRAEQPA